MKTIYIRDGANVDGAPKRLPYDMAEMSDLPQNITAPAAPIPVLSGPATETFSQLRRTRVDYNSVTFTWRMRITITTANGWVFYTIPQIAGFQFPEVTCDGVYMQTGDNEASGVQNAAMRMNGVVWADIGRIYYSQSSGKDTQETWWPQIKAKYTRL